MRGPPGPPLTFFTAPTLSVQFVQLTGVFVLIDILESLKAEKTLRVLFPHTDGLLARDQEEFFFAPPPPAVFRGFLFLCSGTLK